ncbi:MAG: TolC family protein [Deltaproteobacteria bacterium]|nr:TolC family protein [Deltaproteobacteria bacterium]
MGWTRALGLALAATLTLPAGAQEVGPSAPEPPIETPGPDVMGIDEARARVERHALTVALARWDREAAQADVARWTGAALPSIAGFVSLSVGAGLTPFGFPRPVASQAGVGVSGSVRLLDVSTWAAAASARRSLRGQEATVGWARVQAREQATQLYAVVVGEQAVARALEEARSSAEEDARAVDELVAAGLRPSADAARTRSEVLDLRARSIEARGRATAACAALQDLMAVEVNGRCVLQPLLEIEPGEGPLTHPALVAAAEAVAAAQAAQVSAIGAQLPVVEASGQVAAYAIESGGGPGWSAGLDVNVPLRILNEGRGEVMAATAARGRADTALAGQRRALDAARVGAEARFEAARVSVVAREGSVEAAAAALKLVQERYRAGLSNVSALLDARRAEVDARVGLARSRAARWAALASVESARGVQGRLAE